MPLIWKTKSPLGRLGGLVVAAEQKEPPPLQARQPGKVGHLPKIHQSTPISAAASIKISSSEGPGVASRFPIRFIAVSKRTTNQISEEQISDPSWPEHGRLWSEQDGMNSSACF